MAWLINSERLDALAAHVRKKGWTIDEWWRNETALAEWWDILGHPSGMENLVAVPAGDVVAWVARIGDVWNFSAYSKPLGVISATYNELATVPRKNGGRKLDERFITQWVIPRDPPIPARPAEIGEWCGCSEHRGGGRIGRVAEIDGHGRITSVEIKPDTVLPASDYAKKWFSVQGRDEACAARWRHGETSFKAYIAMLSSLAREQKKLTGTPAGRAPQGKASVSAPIAAAIGRPAADDTSVWLAEREAMIHQLMAGGLTLGQAAIAIRPIYAERMEKMQQLAAQ